MANQVRNPIRNIRIADNVWRKAKKDAVDRDMTLQDWVSLCLSHCGSANNRNLTEMGK